MDQLWAPWRMAYLATAPKPDAEGACFLCGCCAASDDRANLVAYRAQRSIVVLNKFPYNNGHLLVAPLAHKGRLDELDSDEALELQIMLRDLVHALDEMIRPDGYNIGLNLGTAAGAGLPGHLHWHLVPRWHGDTNFMPVLNDTKVISQSLDAFYVMLVEMLRGEGGGLVKGST